MVAVLKFRVSFTFDHESQGERRTKTMISNFVGVPQIHDDIRRNVWHKDVLRKSFTQISTCIEAHERTSADLNS